MPARPRPYAAPATLVSVAGVLTFAVIALVALSGAQAAAEQPKCGDTISADTTLHHDLVNCSKNAIVIGADGITLDLNGHLIDGDETSSSKTCDCAVFNDGHDGVTVRDGSVREFDIGVLVEHARHNRLLDISSSRNHFQGLGFFHSARSLVKNSSGNGSTSHDGSGMFLIASRHVRILDNTFRRNGDHAITVFRSTHNHIIGNRLSRNRGAGINMSEGGGTNRNEVRGNRIVRGGDGIDIAGNRNVITRNHIDHSGGEDGSAISLDAGDHNLIARNSVRDPSVAGIGLGFGRAVDNDIRRNRVRGAGEDGLRVLAKAEHTLLWHNLAVGAGDDGLDVNSSTTKLTRNEARRNGDLGIEAVPGVIDGGGNVARHNGDPRQCTHVACS